MVAVGWNLLPAMRRAAAVVVGAAVTAARNTEPRTQRQEDQRRDDQNRNNYNQNMAYYNDQGEFDCLLIL